jgi:chromosome partitioning protein
MILTVGGEKGGVGKSTIALHLTYMLKQAGHDPLLIDADPQGSATNFGAARDGTATEPRIEIIQKTGRSLGLEIRALAERYSDLVIDTGGRDTIELRLAMLVSELVVVPINCSAFNWWTLEKIDGLAGEARLSNPELRVAVLLNRAPGNPALRRRKINVTVDRLHDARFQYLSVLESVLVERTAFQDNEEFGLTVFEPSVIRGVVDANACTELMHFFKEATGYEYPSSTLGAATEADA